MDCWGNGYYGELGNGTFYNTSSPFGSSTPVEVEGVGGSGTLTGVTNLVSHSDGYCALLVSGGVDCWGYGPTANSVTESATRQVMRGVRCPSRSDNA